MPCIIRGSEIMKLIPFSIEIPSHKPKYVSAIYVSDLLKWIKQQKKWTIKSPHTEQELDGYISALNDLEEEFDWLSGKERKE